MAGRKHTHKYYRMELDNDSRTRVWACARESCTHYMPKHLERMMLNRKSLCWSCGEEFTLDALAMQFDKPTCTECNPTTQSLLDAVLKLEKA